MPGPCELCGRPRTLSRSASQATSRSALGLIRSAVTEPPVTFERVLVERRGEQRAPRGEPGPGEVGVARGVRRALQVDRLAPCRASTAAASVIRRWARRPSGSAAGSSGASAGHQIATGESGSSSGSTTDSACLTTSPLSRIRAVSPVQPSPVPTWALTCGGAAGVAEDHAEHPRRVLVRGLAGDLHRLVGAVLVDDDDQGHHHAHRRAAGARVRALTNSAAIPAALVSVSSIMCARVHGRLQTRPSRASIASARLRPPAAARRTAPACPCSPSGRGSGRGSARTARPPRGGGTAAGRRGVRRGSAARRPPALDSVNEPP